MIYPRIIHKTAGLYFLALLLTAFHIIPNMLYAQNISGAAPRIHPPYIAKNLPTDQPFASYWFPNELLSWTPAGDPDAAYNRSGVPLAGRFSDSLTQVNSHARANEAKINNLSIFWATSGNPSQGALDVNYNAYNYWQYLDVLVFWGGSAGEGLILAPNPGIIDAAHRNGVEVLGTIFFPPTVFGGQIQWVHDMLQRSGSSFPVADKLIEVAEYYGFDGWFINQETEGGNAALAADMRDFMIYIQRNSNLRIQWYDAMTESGIIFWQEQLNANNDMFFQFADTLVSDYMFLDFGWTTGDLNISRINANNLNRSEYDLFAAINVQSNGYNTFANWSAVFPENNPHVTSLAFFVPSWCYSSSSGLQDFYQRANRFWVGANRNPANTTTPDTWKGLAHYVPAKSPIDALPFVTNFNTGQGFDFYKDGQRVSPDEWSAVGWNNIGLQDVLPTWRWLVESTGFPIFPEIDWSDAFYGGSSLKISGVLSGDNLLRLFKTRLEVSPATRLEIAYRTAPGPTHMKAALLYEDAPASYEHIDLGQAADSSWQVFSVDLGLQSGRRIIEVSLFFEAGGGSFETHIGRIALRDGPLDTPVAPQNLVVERKVEESNSEATLRLRWNSSPGDIYSYNVYRVNPDSSRSYLGGTANNAYFVPSVRRIGSEADVQIEVTAISPEFGESPPATTSFNWDAGQPPGLAGDPLPADGETEVITTIDISWTAGAGAESHDVYFGTANPPPFAGNQATTIYDPGLLQNNTLYYWRIDEVNSIATTTGSLWQFTTSDVQLDTNGFALSFDGLDDHLNLGNHSAIQITGSEITLEAWINAASWQPNVWQGSILNKERNGAGSDFGYMLRAGNSGQLNFNLGSGNWQEINSSSGALQLNTWHHIAGSYDGATMRLYIDGMEVASSNRIFSIGNAGSTNLWAGNSQSNPNRYFNGIIDEIRIWNVSRSVEQLQQTMARVLDSTYYSSTDSGLVGYWRLDEGSGQLTADLSPSGNNGILGSGPSVDDSDPAWVSPAPLVDISPQEYMLPEGFSLQQNYPNPFNPKTVIRYSLSVDRVTTLKIYDVTGREVKTLVNERQQVGSYSIEWDGRDDARRPVASGIYFYRLRAGDFVQTRRMLLMK